MKVCLGRLAVLTVLVGAALPAVSQTQTRPGVEIAVLRNEHSWTADLEFHDRAPVWAFEHSALLRDSRRPWRPLQWRVLTDGVRLDHAGGRDILRTENGRAMPAKVRIELEPASAAVEASYNPALVFSDGSVALHSDQFDMAPFASLKAVEAAAGTDLPKTSVEVSWRDTSGPVLFRGLRAKAPVMQTAQTYVLFGGADAIETGAFAFISDPKLPPWINDAMSGLFPDLVRTYTSRLEREAPLKPVVLASWNGPTPDIYSMGGSVLPGLIAMSFEGEHVVAPSDSLLMQTRLFLAHEAAHFWLGQAVVYERDSDLWITEGGADLMAARVLETIDPDFPSRDFLQTAVDDCTTLLSSGPVATANSRGQQRAHYVCGMVFARVAESAGQRTGRTDWLDVVAEMLRTNSDDQIITRAEWMDGLTAMSGDARLAAEISRLLDEPVGDPASELSGLLTHAGIVHSLQDGKVRLD